MTAPVSEQRVIKLQKKQMKLLAAIRDRRADAPVVLGFGGSRGCAKSGGVRRIILGLAQETPCIIWLIRRVWDDLNKDHVKPLFQEQPWIQQYWHAQDREIRMPTLDGKGSSSIFFIHSGDSQRAKRKARGPQAHYIFLEQAEEFSQEEMERLAGSNRAPGTAPGFCKRIFTFNPGGVGTSYLRRIFHKREYADNETPGDYLFIQGYGWDNFEWFRGLPDMVTEREFYSLPEYTSEEWFEDEKAKVRLYSNRLRYERFIKETDFGKKLNALPPSQRIGELLGSFEHFGGMYYADVWEESALFISQEKVMKLMKPWWRRWLGTDWGFSHYSATFWAGTGIISPDECRQIFNVQTEKGVPVIIVYRECLTKDVTEPDLASLIAAMTPPGERKEIRFHFMGHDAWAKRGSANTVVEQMDPVLTKNGLRMLSRADIDRVGGWRLLYNCWAETRRFIHAEGVYEPTDFPLLFIGEGCPEIKSAIPMLEAGNPSENEDPKDIIKVPGAMEDDVADGLRYTIKSYLAADPKIPDEVIARETFEAYQDPTARAMAMLRLQAKQDSGRFIQRRRRR